MNWSTITLPTSIGGATKALNSLDGLVTAKQWERAAIVYAFTYEAGRGRPSNNGGHPTLLTIAAFADLGIAGLATRETVALYRKRWDDHPETADDLAPGGLVELPTTPWERTTKEWKPKADVASLTPDQRVAVARDAITDPDLAVEVFGDRKVRMAASPAMSQALEDEKDMARPARAGIVREPFVSSAKFLVHLNAVNDAVAFISANSETLGPDELEAFRDAAQALAMELDLVGVGRLTNETIAQFLGEDS